MTNGDKIRAMTDKELSKFISDLSVGNCCACPAKKECLRNDITVNRCSEMIDYWLKRKADK